MLKIRKGDKGLLEIGEFIFRRTDQASSCGIRFEVRFKFGDSFWQVDVGKRPQPRPLVGFIDENDPAQIMDEVPLTGVRLSRSRIAIDREPLWRALAEAAAADGSSPWARDRVDIVLDVGYYLYSEDHKSGRFADQKDKIELEVYLEPEQPTLQFAGSYLLAIRQPLGVRREDGTVQAGKLVRKYHEDRSLSDPVKIVLRQEATVRFRREVLLAFAINPQLGQGGAITPSVVKATVRVKLPDGSIIPPLRPLFEICKISKDGPTHGEFWNLSVCPPWPLRVVERNWMKTDYRLAAMNTYVLCLRPCAVNFEIEGLFPAADSRIIVEIALHSYPWNESDENVRRIEIAFERSDKDLLMVSTGDGHKAVVFDVHASSVKERISILDDKAEPGDITATVFNLSRTPVHRRVDAKLDGLDVSFEAGVACEVMVERRLPRISIYNGNGESAVEIGFDPVTRLSARIVALDIGTMATAVCLCGDDGDMALAKLGEVVKGVTPNRSRRESAYLTMLASICGISIVDLPDGHKGNPPVRILSTIDDRIKHTLRDDLRDNGDRMSNLRERLQATGSPLEVHLPLWDPAHEKSDMASILDRGFISIASAKPQVCAFEFLTLKRDVNAFRAGVYRASQEKFEPVPVLAVCTADLLWAVLDALLAVYLPSANWAIELRIDHDYVLTYPASIGEEARQRYYSAFSWVLAGMRHVAEKGVPDVFDLRGRHRLRLVPEAVAACYALADSAKLWRQRKPIRRLILFDVGAGTFDVSAMEFQLDDLICQTVSFSVPLGGDELDRALVRDVHVRLTGHVPSPEQDISDLIRRIESAKRRMSNDLFAKRFLPILLSDGGADLIPAKGDIFERGGDPWMPLNLLKPREDGSRHTWIVLDLQDPSLRDDHLHAYLQVIERLVVAPTMRASGPPEEEYGEVEVVMSGRASLFEPLRQAVRAGVNRAEGWEKRGMEPRLASDIFNGDSAMEDAENMKSLVARGAALWARRAERAEAEESEWMPIPSHILNHFALLSGVWKEGDEEGRPDLFEVSDIIDISLGTTVHEVPEGLSLFVVVRPPLLKSVDLPEELTLFGSELINQCIRPVVLSDDASHEGRYSPLPFGERGLSKAKIELAASGDRVELTVACVEGSLSIQAIIAGKRPRSWNLSSTFTVQREI
jgi:hypothetical protein